MYFSPFEPHFVAGVIIILDLYLRTICQKLSIQCACISRAAGFSLQVCPHTESITPSYIYNEAAIFVFSCYFKVEDIHVNSLTVARSF